MRILRCLIAVGLLSSGVSALAETAPGTLTVSVVVIDRCIVSNAVFNDVTVKCNAAAPPHRVIDEMKPFASAGERVRKTVLF